MKRKIVGIPGEIRNAERWVVLTPASTWELTSCGDEAVVETRPAGVQLPAIGEERCSMSHWRSGEPRVWWISTNPLLGPLPQSCERGSNTLRVCLWRSTAKNQKRWRIVRNGTPPKVTLEDGLLAVAVGEGGHRSIDQGRPVTLSEVLDG